MEWNPETLSRLSEIFGEKSRKIQGQIPTFQEDKFAAYHEAWSKYISGLGLKMESIHDIPARQIECSIKSSGSGLSYESVEISHIPLRPSYEQHCSFVSKNGTRMVRIVNAWFDRCIEMTEDFAFKVLALGYIPDELG